MIALGVQLLLHLVVVFSTPSSAASKELQFNGGKFNVTWNYLPESQEIEFKVRAITTGYVAMGLTKTNSYMKELDVFTAGVRAGTSFLKDRYATRIGAIPPEDAKQSYVLISASQSKGITTVHCKRKLLTNDDKDLQIKAGDKVYIAWAMHPSSDNIRYHGRTRGYSSQMYDLVSDAV